MTTLIHSLRSNVFRAFCLLVILTMLLPGPAAFVRASATDASAHTEQSAAASSSLTKLLDVYADAQFQMVDDFETHNWHAPSWGDPHTLTYSSEWKTQGNTSLKLTVTSYTGNGWALYSTGCFDPEAPDAIVLDVKNPEDFWQELKLEYLEPGLPGQEAPKGSLGTQWIAPNTTATLTYLNPDHVSIRMLRLVQGGYSGDPTLYVDNIRFVKGAVTTLWDGAESHLYWDGTADADNKDYEAAQSDDITHALHSPNFGSTASQVLEWDAAIHPTATTAEVHIRDLTLDYSDYWYFRFDVYRPSSTPNVEIFVYLYDGNKGSGSYRVKVDTPDQWTTVTLPMWSALNLGHITEIHLVVPDTDVYTSGRLYFDNLQVGGFLPEATPVDLSTLGHPHVVKDFSDGLDGNNFYGEAMTGTGNGGVITQTIETTTYWTQPSLRVEYDVTNEIPEGEETNYAYVYYVNTLDLNSDKNMLALYLKGGTHNPGRVKLEFHDKNWASSGQTTGSAFAYLSGLSSTTWKQWIVPIDPAKLQVVGSFDPTSVREVVLSLDKPTANDDAKVGSFYVDDITFVDSTDILTPFPWAIFPETTPVDARQIGVPYLLDDFDGRVLDQTGKVVNLGYTEMFGYTGVGSGVVSQPDYPQFAGGYVASTERGDIAHSAPFAWVITYTFPALTDAYVYYYSLMSVHGGLQDYKDLSMADKFSIWVRGTPGGNPGKVRVEFHDNTWGEDTGWSTGKATATLLDISDSVWQQYLISMDVDDLDVLGSFDPSKLKEVVLSFDYAMAKDKSGALYVDDMQFIDTDQVFTTTADFQSDAFLDLVERRTFQYFLEAYDADTGLVADRVHYRDLATTAGTGFGLTAMVIGVERGWISRADAEAYTLKVLNTLWNTPQGTAITGTSGYKGFYYHFLEASTGLRKIAPEGHEPVELSIVDTAILMAGVLTVREYFSTTPEIVTLADNLYNRVEWDWFLDTSGTPDTNPNYNQFYMGWTPENGFLPYHWDYATDESILIDLLAIGSPTHPVPPDVFYAWQRHRCTYNGHDVIVSYNGAMFQYFFANCWFDLYGKIDAQGVDWWANSVEAGLANRDFCIAGVDGQGHTNVSTYSANSWGLTSAEGIPAGLDHIYLGGNGARPNGNVDVDGNINWQTEGTVPPYGGISMIGFSAHPEGIPVSYITDLMQNYYQNTQLWGGWYGFRDAYTDADRIKVTKIYSPTIDAWVTITATSLYPQYKAAYFAIDQGPIVLMLENYRTGLVWNIFMRNTAVQNAMNAVFSPRP
ncbi:MAG: hypothetical protein DRI52_03330 [Chloroflexi bacterium]|nr:MAG: hypothetical protein DRI52_03330 [Chloroflexota bacterium]